MLFLSNLFWLLIQFHSFVTLGLSGLFVYSSFWPSLFRRYKKKTRQYLKVKSFSALRYTRISQKFQSSTTTRKGFRLLSWRIKTSRINGWRRVECYERKHRIGKMGNCTISTSRILSPSHGDHNFRFLHAIHYLISMQFCLIWYEVKVWRVY